MTRNKLLLIVVIACVIMLYKMYRLEYFESFWALLSGLATFLLQEWRFSEQTTTEDTKDTENG